MSNTIQNNGWYVIMNVNSRTVADLNNGDSSDGTKIQGWDVAFDSASSNQVWQFQQEGDAWRIINQAAGTSWDLNNGDSSNGTRIQGWAKGDTNNQRWYVNQISGSKQVCRWIISNKGSGTNADLNNGSNTNGTSIQGWKGDNSVKNQQWILLGVN